MVYRKRPQRRNKKRGFGLNATLGRNVPFLGGSSLSIGTRAVKRIVRREFNSHTETKQFVWNTSFAGAALDNTIYTSAPVHYIPQSIDESGRTGRKIFFRHLRLQGTYTATADLMMRVLVVWSEQTPTLAAGPTPTLQDATLGSTSLFHPTSNKLVTALINNKLGNRVICDRLYHVKTDASTAQVNRWQFDCPINQSIQFMSAGIPSYLSEKQMYVLVIPHQAGLSTASPTTLKLEMNGIITYKDA